ncbi:MAG: hypothetical protein QOJ51_5321 [Acidobacteriaceae bacterium]|nr:hypothetical protein [Acidobacteriaceae bacterium]
MTERVAFMLALVKNMLPAVCEAVGLAVAVLFGLLYATEIKGQTQADQAAVKLPAFEVASIKPDKSGTQMIMFRLTPDGINVTNTPLKMLIQQAYGVEENQVIGLPNGLSSERYDVEAKVDSSDVAKLHDLDPHQRTRMLQPVLAERFQLKVHRETRNLPVYELVLAKGGPKFHEAKPGDTYSNGIKGPDGHSGPGLMWLQDGRLTCQAVGMTELTRILSQRLGHNVLDKTGLTGKYDLAMEWPPEDRPGPMSEGGEGGNAGESSGPSIFTVIQEQLGLKLESHKTAVEVLVIDHVEAPSAN